MNHEIIQAPDPRLMQPSLPVEVDTSGVRELVGFLMTTRIKHRSAGLAAVQIGFHLRVVATDPTKFFGFTAVLNPEIVHRGSQTIEDDEGCMSIGMGVPRFKVRRHQVVTVKLTDRHGSDHIIVAKGFSARLIQHEIDHLDGKLIA